LFGNIGFLIIIKAFTGRDSVRKNWFLIMLNHITIAISFNEHFDWMCYVWYLCEIIVAWFVSLIVFNKLIKQEWVTSLANFYNHSYEHTKLAILFLLPSLQLSGFPITPSSVGEDFIFLRNHSNQIDLAFFTALSWIINSLASTRIYTRVFLSPLIKTYQEVVICSS